VIRTVSGFAIRRPMVVVVLGPAVVGAGFGVGTGVSGPVPSAETRPARRVPDVPNKQDGGWWATFKGDEGNLFGLGQRGGS
jgi:RND superfamily putative drug exporter